MVVLDATIVGTSPCLTSIAAPCMYLERKSTCGGSVTSYTLAFGGFPPLSSAAISPTG
jgi:hypothetical protein